MSIKNLFVNARTKILEFKRKHNALVEKVNETPSLIASAIQADKNMLEKITIEYDEDNNKTIVTLPEKTIPLKFVYHYGYTSIIFIENGKVCDNAGNEKEGITYQFQWITTAAHPTAQNHYRIIFTGNKVDELSIKKQYIYLPCDQEVMIGYFDGYHILNPLKSSGTKLYKHTFHILYNDGDYNIIDDDVEVISLMSAPVTNNNNLRNLLNTALSIYCDNYFYVILNGQGYIWLNDEGDSEVHQVNGFTLDGTDLVTPL